MSIKTIMICDSCGEVIADTSLNINCDITVERQAGGAQATFANEHFCGLPCLSEAVKKLQKELLEG